MQSECTLQLNMLQQPDQTALPARTSSWENGKKGSSRDTGESGEAFCCSLFLLLRAQKKKQEKGTPTSPGPTGFPYFSPGAGRGKTRASPSDSSRVFSAPVCEARQDKWGEENSHWHAAEYRRGCRKGDLHCLSAASLQSPGSIEERRASRLQRDKPGCLFFGSFLWASKEMNGLISSPLSPEFPDEQKKARANPG